MTDKVIERGDDGFYWMLAGVLAVMAIGAAVFEAYVPIATYGDKALLITLGFVAAMLVAMLPTFIALALHKRNRLAIAALNLLLGWTFIGWVVALVWALMRDDSRTTRSA